MAKSKKIEAKAEEVLETSVESVDQSPPTDSGVGPSYSELMDKMKKEGKSYVRIKKLF